MENLTIGDIAAKVAPVAEKYALRYVWLFGSRARGDARPDSDVDLLTTMEGSHIKSLTDLGGLYMDFKDVLGTELDIATLEGIQQSLSSRRFSSTAQTFQAEIEKEKVLIYEFRENDG